MKEEAQLSEKESLELITSMIEKAKASSHDTGLIALLWGSVVTIAALVTYLQEEFQFKIGFDIWWLVLLALAPHLILIAREKKAQRVRKHEDDALDAVWMAYAISIFGLVFYQNVIASATTNLTESQGWVMMKHYTDGSRPDTQLQPFAPSIYSLFLLLYALPTLVTGLVKKFKPMVIGAVLTYLLFAWSCFTAAKYDMLLGAVASLACWFIPGLILRKKYLAQSKVHV